MYLCNACQAVFDEVDELTEERILEEIGDEPISPEDVANALESAGTRRCPECFTPDEFEELGG